MLVQPGSAPFQDGNSHVETVFAGTGRAADYAGLSARGKAVVVRADAWVTPADQAAAARAAGAAMLLVVNNADGRLIDWYGNPDGHSTGLIPVASLTVDEGADLIKKITSPGKTKLKVEAHPSPQYLYDLADYHHGGIPEDPSAATDPAASPASTTSSPRPPASRSRRAARTVRHTCTGRPDTPTPAQRLASRRSRGSRSHRVPAPTGSPPATA